MKPQEYMERLNRLQDLAHQARHDFTDGTGDLKDRLGAIAREAKDFINAIDAEKGGRKIDIQDYELRTGE